MGVMIVVCCFAVVWCLVFSITAYFTAVFYSFSFASVAKQITIANEVMVNQSKPIVLYDRNFTADHFIIILRYRIAVDVDGRWAVLNEGAQRAFFPLLYYFISSKCADVEYKRGVIVLPCSTEC